MHSLLNWSYSARSRSGEESWPRTAQETPIQRARRNHRFFPAPITPASEISLTSSLTAGGLSDFNHTSMLVPQNNLHCLSVSSALSEAVSTRRRPRSVIRSYQRTAVPVADLRPGQGRARAGWGSREEGERMTIPPSELSSILSGADVVVLRQEERSRWLHPGGCEEKTTHWNLQQLLMHRGCSSQ